MDSKKIDLTFTKYEMLALLNEVIENNGKVQLLYKTKDENIIGFEIIENVDSVYDNNYGISCMLSNEMSTCGIIIPENMKDCIPCTITHTQVETIDFDKVPDEEKEWFLLNSPMEKDISEEYKYTKDYFTLHIYGFKIEVNMENKTFNHILENINSLTTKYLNDLFHKERLNSDVDIEGFWESIDNAMES